MSTLPLILHWPLNGHTDDIISDVAARARNITWTNGPGGNEHGAALFNGIDSVVEVPDSPKLQLGCDEFSISAWVKCVKPMRGAFGDVLSKFDAERRCGFNLWISGGSATYSSNSDARYVHAGIDDGYRSAWRDCGRPGDGSGNPLVSCMTTYEGDLYASLSDATSPEESCKVFRWDGDSSWIDCGRLGTDPHCLSVMSMIVHNGHLYAGTGIWDWGRAEAARNETPRRVLTRVFRYEGGTTWRDLGQIGRGQRVLCLASFNGALYAGLDAGGDGACFKWENERWEFVGATQDGDNFECLMPLGGVLYGTSHSTIYRYQGGTHWKVVEKNPFGITQIHSLQVADGKLWIGTWPQGYILRLEENGKCTNTGQVGIAAGMPGVAMINEINALGVHNGKLYAGTIPKAQVYRYERDGHWSLLDSLASRSDWDPQYCPSWMRILSLTTHRGMLFASTGTSQARHWDLDPDQTAGRVLSCHAGIAASYEHDIAGEWTHLCMVRKSEGVLLYVNGNLAQSTPMPRGHHFHLGNAQPLLIGSGTQSSFDGAISDVRLYGAALNAVEVQEIAALPGRAPVRELSLA
jgi:hypothetical protein